MRKYIVIDPINSDLNSFETLKEAQDFIINDFTDEDEGIHPEIESVFIIEAKSQFKINVIPNDEDENYTIEFNQQLTKENK